MQVHRRVDLGPHDGVELVPGQRRDRTVVQQSGRVHDGGQRVLLRNRSQELVDRIPVGRVTGDDGHVRPAVLQLGAQFAGSRSRRPAAAGQQQVPHSPFPRQVASEQTAEQARTAGDQHRAIRVPEQLVRAVAALAAARLVGRVGARRIGMGAGADQAWSEDRTAPYGHLGFVDRKHGGQGCFPVGGVVDVDQHETAGILRLGGAHQTPDGGMGQIGRRLVRARDDGAPCHHDQLGPGRRLIRQPLLDRGQHLAGDLVYHLGEFSTPDRSAGQDHVLRIRVQI